MEAGAAQIASSEVIRDINRRIVLNLIRTRQPITRADLARTSGMQRSTISLIVEELLTEGWVLEGETVRLPRGRRPTFLRLNEEKAIIGVDIRATHTTVAVADINGVFGGVFGPATAMPTPADPETAVREIVARIEDAVRSCAGKKIEGVGITLPGRYDQSTGRLVFAPNLGWRDVDLRTPIVKATGLEVELENAANACALAAVWFDSWESYRNLVVLTVSEGIGTGILVNGQLARGLGGMAGEFGHVSLDPEGPVCGCGSRGCWEVFGSNRAAIRYYREATGETEGIPFLDLLSRADAGDLHAVGALEQMAHQLGRGMRIIVAGLAPERIIVVGDLTRAWNRFAELLEADVADQVLPGGQAPELIPAPADGMARLRGTVALVLWNHFTSHREVLL